MIPDHDIYDGSYNSHCLLADVRTKTLLCSGNKRGNSTSRDEPQKKKKRIELVETNCKNETAPLSSIYEAFSLFKCMPH